MSRNGLGNHQNSSCPTDNEPPSLQGCNFGDISQPTDAASDEAVVNWTPPVGLDNAGAPTVSSNFNPGMAFPVGVTTVTYTATDAAGLTSMCSFNISVSGKLLSQGPAIIVCY